MSEKTILVVDDNAVILKFMNSLLTKLGHTVVCVSDEFKCIDLLSELRPDVVFLDLVMPKIGGLDLCRIIRSKKELEKSFIVILSAAVVEYDVDFTAAGADCCIAKGPLRQMAYYVKEAIQFSEKPRTRQPREILGIKDVHTREITRELIQKNDRLHLLLDEMSQGIVELSESRIVYVNPQAVAILERSKEELLGSHIAESLPDQLLEALDKIDSKQQDTTHFFENRPIQLGPRQITFEKFSIAASLSTTIIMMSDVTEQRRMETMMQATNLTENLGYVFSGIRHEIGNPVNSIKVALSVLQSNLEEYDKKTIGEFIDRSQQEIARIEYLLLALKNFSLLEQPIVEELSGNDFINNFITLVKTDFEKNRIKVQSLLPDNDFPLWVDGRALHHILLNLFTNAADAVAERRYPVITVCVTEKKEMVEIRIEDNGSGISDTEKKHLFKPFFTSKLSGTGLGLVIAKKLINTMNGDIFLESYEGIGTSAILTLPARPGG